jgi:hypothetical protein
VVYDLERKLALISVYQSLGGGWNLSDAQWSGTGTGAIPVPSNPQPPSH